MLKGIQTHLGIKLFLSYLLVLLTGIVVLASFAEISTPTTFRRHMMAGRLTPMMENSDVNQELLFRGFRAALNEALIFGGLTAFIVAIVVSLIVSRRIVKPIQEMTEASLHIAQGHYHERVKVGSPDANKEMDELAVLASSFNQMADQLEQTENRRKQLIGDITHELRTPLTTIKGSMEGLIDGLLIPPQEIYQQIYQEADRLQRLVNDLQELSRVEAGSLELKCHPIPVERLFEGTRKRLGIQFEEKGVKLEILPPQNLPYVLADEDRVGQVLLNLVGNALQYTPQDGMVTLSAKKVGSDIYFSIADTGIGIEPEQLNLIFDRFYRIDKSRSRIGGGSGIGATIAKYLVEAHGGKIWAESPGLEKGSTFTFTLPTVK